MVFDGFWKPENLKQNLKRGSGIGVDIDTGHNNQTFFVLPKGPVRGSKENHASED